MPRSKRTASRRGQPTVGQIGLGIMGSAFSKHLLAAGYRVVGYDIARAKVDALARRGGQRAGSCAEVAAGAPIIITSLPSVAAFEVAMFGPDGIANGAKRGTIVIEASTLPLEVKMDGWRRMAQQGVTVLDCPISGTGAQAAAKDIVVYASGERRVFGSCRKVFAGFARAAYYCGEFGAGSKLKFVANLLVTIHNVSAAEAMVLGKKAGIDLRLLYDVVRDGAGTSRMFEVRGPLMIADHYLPATMKTELYQKDIDIIRGFALKLGCPTPLFDASQQLYTAARAQGRAKQDTASVFAVLSQMANLKTRR